MSQFSSGRVFNQRVGSVQGLARPPFYPQWGGLTKQFLDQNLFQVERAPADWERLHPVVFSPQDFTPAVGPQLFVVPPGGQGDEGPQGPIGPEGPCPIITATPPEFVTVTPTGPCNFNFNFVPAVADCPTIDAEVISVNCVDSGGGPCNAVVVVDQPDPEVCAFTFQFTFTLEQGEQGPQGVPGQDGQDGAPGTVETICRIVSKIITGDGGTGDRFVFYTCQPVIFDPGTASYVDTGAPIAAVRNRDEFRRRNFDHFGLMLEQFTDPLEDMIVEVRIDSTTAGEPPASESRTFNFPLPTMFPVIVSQNGGSAGDATSQCSFTYQVLDLEGNVLFGGALQAPVAAANQRPLLGAMRAANRGIVAWDETTMEMVLWRVFETPVVEVCPEQGALQFDQGGNSPLLHILTGI